jgi:hypothetical protein
MKLFYLIVAIAFSLVLIIFGFGNVGSSCSPMNFFFSDLSALPVPLIIFFIGILGMIPGAFYVLFFFEYVKEKSEEEDEGTEL